MADARIHASAQRVKAAIRQYGDQLTRYALPVALTRTAQDAKLAVQRALPETFDRPTPYTVNATFVRPATKADPVAWVGFKDDWGKGTPAARYLLPNVEGGPRRDKRMERQLRAAGLLPAGMFAVPGEEASLDAYGNMRRSEVVRILSQTRAFGEQGYTANRSDSARSRKKRRRNGYFAALPGNAGGLPPGIYQRDGADARPVVIFVRAPSYRPRFRFHDIVERAVRANIGRRLEEAVRTVNARFAARR